MRIFVVCASLFFLVGCVWNTKTGAITSHSSRARIEALDKEISNKEQSIWFFDRLGSNKKADSMRPELRKLKEERKRAASALKHEIIIE